MFFYDCPLMFGGRQGCLKIHSFSLKGRAFGQQRTFLSSIMPINLQNYRLKLVSFKKALLTCECSRVPAFARFWAILGR